MTDDVTVVGFLRGLRIAILAMTVTILFGLSLPGLLARFGAPPGPVVQSALFLLLLGIAGVDAVLVFRDRFWGALAWPVLGVILLAYLGFTLLLPAGSVFTVDNWYFQVVGWFGVLLLFDRPLPSVLVYLLAYVAVTAVGRTESVGLLITAVSVGGFQALTASAAGALRRVASSAARAAEEESRTRIRRAVARRVHSDRRRRYREVATTAGPLLSGLADGSLDPSDTEVIRRCAIEAARMRRLFAEIDDTGDRLLHEVRACADIAERKGVTVEVISHGTCPDLPREIRHALTDGAMRVLSTLRDTAVAARVTVTSTPDSVSVSVLADGATIAEFPETHNVSTTSLFENDQTWVEVTWQA